MSFITIITIIFYLLATVLLVARYKVITTDSKNLVKFINLAGLIAVICHGDLVYVSIFVDGGLDFGFFNMVSLVAWMVTIIILVTSAFRPLTNLLLALFPISIISILLEILIPDQRLLANSASNGLKIHILLSICAYSMLMIATLQAIILAVQEKMLKSKRAAAIMNILPPLRIMETLLVQFIVIGYFLLSLSLASGLMFIEDLFTQHLVHKTVLAIVAWLAYSIMIWGRWTAGWRGKTIIRWTIGAFTSLLLAYFGSKFVLELLLQRV